jgi:HK97 family phage major capsid protein
VAVTKEGLESLKNDIREAAKVNPDDVRQVLDEMRGADEPNVPSEPHADDIRDELVARPSIVKVGDNREHDVYLQTFRLISGVSRRDHHAVRKAQRELALMGEYGDEWQRVAQASERAVMLTSAEGQPFLPTAVINKIEDIALRVGIVRPLVTTYSITSGDAKLPNVSGRLTAFAVNEASTIKARKADFGSVTLDPMKWGVIVPWTQEMSDEVGAQFVAKVVELAGEAFANEMDATVLTADGTATYHSLTGLLSLAGVGEATMASGDGNFNDIDYDDLIDLRAACDVGVKARGDYIIHPDFEETFLKFKDGAGHYLFPAASGVERATGRPIHFTEVMPAKSTSDVSTSFALYGDFSFVSMGIGQTLQVALLTEATIQDVDDLSLIHLAATDSQALRFTMHWDVKVGLPRAFSKLTTAASTT